MKNRREMTQQELEVLHNNIWEGLKDRLFKWPIPKQMQKSFYIEEGRNETNK
jgi:hypothetical protein